MSAVQFVQDLKKYARGSEDTTFLARFFKTGKGEYGEGDIFIGVRAPEVRAVCKKHHDLSLQEIETLLEDPIHEVRLGAVIIMADQMIKSKDETYRKAIYDLYLRRTDRINNWDIVDCSCRDVVGRYLEDKSRRPLYALARSANIWERRIAMVSTWHFIRTGDLQDAFAIAELLLGDTHDLIHKAVGWMLREAGKRDEARLLAFLDIHAAAMPRTALRYAIERLSVQQKMQYMQARARKEQHHA